MQPKLNRSTLPSIYFDSLLLELAISGATNPGVPQRENKYFS